MISSFFLLYPSVFSVLFLFPLCVFPSWAFCLNLVSGISATFLLHCLAMPSPLWACLQWQAKKKIVFFAFGAVCSFPSPNNSQLAVQHVGMKVVWDRKENRANTILALVACFHTSLSCMSVCVLSPLVLFPWVVVVQLSAGINGGLVFLGCIQLLHCSTPVFLLTFCVCTVCVCCGGCAHLATVHVFWEAGLEREGWGLQSGVLCARLVAIA